MDEQLKNQIIKFRDDRNWEQFHNSKDLAISLMLEASELLENFQWSTSEEALARKSENIQEELADVLILCVLIADAIGADISAIVEKKLKKNEEKYPVDKAYGRKEKYTEL